MEYNLEYIGEYAQIIHFSNSGDSLTSVSNC